MHKAIYAAVIISMIVIGGPGNNYTIYRTNLSNIKDTFKNVMSQTVSP